MAARNGSCDGERSDLLTLLLEALDTDGSEQMTEMQLRDEVMTILLAGHETTANALVWSWHYIAANPEVEERLRAEVDSVLGGRQPGLADLGGLKYTRMVFDEALRLRPPVWALFRCPLTDDEAGGYRVPSFTTIILSPYVTHRHPEFWDDAERFDPERFLPERVAGRPRYAFFPFGGGPRMCLGAEFATMEGVLALASIAQEFQIEAVPGHTVELEPLITLRPAGGLPMILRRRNDT
jgi:cytochrome P450